MGQRRMIDADILISPDLEGFSWFQRWLWLALLLRADDHGRVCVETEYLRGTIAGPWRSARGRDVVATLSALCTRRCLDVVDVGGRKFAQINNWTKYQRLNHPRKSTRSREEKNREEMRREGDDARVRAPSPPIPDPCGDSFDAGRSRMALEFGRLFGFAPAKSREILGRRSWSVAFVDAWRPFSDRVRSDPKWTAAIQNWDNPADVPSSNGQSETVRRAMELSRIREMQEMSDGEQMDG